MRKLNGADLEAMYSLHLEYRTEAPYYQTDGEDLLNKCLMDIASRMADEMGLSDAEA